MEFFSCDCMVVHSFTSDVKSLLPMSDMNTLLMQEKHPKAEPADEKILITGELLPTLHPVFYDKLDKSLIKKCILRTHGSAGVSQQEDTLWHKMASGFKESSASLCSAVSKMAIRLATEYVDPEGLEALLANRGVS